MIRYFLLEEEEECDQYDVVLGDSNGLPLNFKSKRVTFSAKRKNRKIVSASTFSENRSEHNIFMGYSQYDGLYYPCRVVGKGPMSQHEGGPDTTIVYFFGYGTYTEVFLISSLLITTMKGLSFPSPSDPF
jgi:hypothetical protein